MSEHGQKLISRLIGQPGLNEQQIASLIGTDITPAHWNTTEDLYVLLRRFIQGVINSHFLPASGKDALQQLLEAPGSYMENEATEPQFWQLFLDKYQVACLNVLLVLAV